MASVDERLRAEIASRAMQGLLAATPSSRPAFDTLHDADGQLVTYADGVARNALRYADALITALALPIPVAQPVTPPR